MTTIFIHDAPQKAEALRARLTTAIGRLPATTAEPLLARLVFGDHPVPSLVFTGHHSGGKSMLIKALTDGAADVLIDADIATDSVTPYTWDGAVILVDTPGVHAGVEGHDEAALQALKAADLVLFVVTPDLFDDLSAQHLRYVADGLGKRDQLLVVVNKAQTMGADPGLRARALAKVLGDGSLPPLLECDAKQYVRSLTEVDEEIADYLRNTSGIDQLRGQINSFSAERGDLAMLRQPFQLIRSIATEAEASLVEDPDERVVFTWLARVRRTLSQHEQTLAQDLTAERAAFLRGVLLDAEAFADAVEALDDVAQANWEAQFACAAADSAGRLNARSDRAAKRMEEVVEQSFRSLSGEMREIDEGPQATLIRSFQDSPQASKRAGDSRWDLRARRSKEPTNPTTSEHMKSAKKLLGQFESLWGAGSGVKASAGSMGHKVTKSVGSRLGKSWKPWESVRLANNIGKAFKAAGVALQIGIVAYEIYSEENRQVKLERARVARRRTIVNQVVGEAEANIDAVIRAIRTIVDVPFQEAYREIDAEWDSLLGDQHSRSDLRDELRAIQEECSQMSVSISHPSPDGQAVIPGHVVP